MEPNVSTYRLERRIALFLALLFLLPFAAHAEEAPPVWRCAPTQIDDFKQCALVMNGEVLTWRMAPANQKLHARVKADGDVTLIEISRDGRNWQTLQPAILQTKR
jgi:hypothetical protein